MSSAAWLRQVGELAEEYGCAVERTEGNHLRLKHPDGWFVFCSSSPSDKRALRYLRSDLRRKAAGVWR